MLYFLRNSHNLTHIANYQFRVKKLQVPFFASYTVQHQVLVSSNKLNDTLETNYALVCKKSLCSTR